MKARLLNCILRHSRCEGNSDRSSCFKDSSKGETIAIKYPAEIIVESTLTRFHPNEVIIEPVKFKSVPLAVILLAKASPSVQRI